MNQFAKLFRRPKTMLKILYLSGNHKFFQKLPGIKFLYDRDRKSFCLLTIEA